jgi:pyruvate/2-oxoglutarate dehydrogenase complex dihydrolipoamide acyltransferase (E2) component
VTGYSRISMPPKRKTASPKATEEPRAKRSRGKAEPIVEKPTQKAKASPKAAKAKEAPAKKAPAKKAEPKAKAPAKAKGPDAEAFVSALLEICKVLMTVVETRMYEDEDAGVILVREFVHASPHAPPCCVRCCARRA